VWIPSSLKMLAHVLAIIGNEKLDAARNHKTLRYPGNDILLAH
jgi:hypothetical protein